MSRLPVPRHSPLALHEWALVPSSLLVCCSPAGTDHPSLSPSPHHASDSRCQPSVSPALACPSLWPSTNPTSWVSMSCSFSPDSGSLGCGPDEVGLSGDPQPHIVQSPRVHWRTSAASGDGSGLGTGTYETRWLSSVPQEAGGQVAWQEPATKRLDVRGARPQLG